MARKSGFYDGKSSNVNKTKAFRISEMYLIAAEAYAMSGDAANASEILNELKAARIKGGTIRRIVAML